MTEAFRLLYKEVYYGAIPKVSVEIQPKLRNAANALKIWYLGSKQKTKNKKNEPHIITPLTSEQIERQRFRFKPNDNIKHLFDTYDTWLTCSLYLRLLPERVKTEFIDYITHSDYCDIDRMKDLSGIMKKYQFLVSENWRYFVDIGTLRDYAKEPTPEEIEEKVRHWVSGNIEHELEGLDFYTLYEAGCDKFMESGMQLFNKKPLTINEFLADPMYWATPGSSDAKRLIEMVSGKKLRARKTKWATAAAISLPELQKLFYDPQPQILRAAPKRELMKARMIIAGDMSNYLRMSYISYWMENTLRNHPNTTLFYNKKQMFKMWADMLDGTKPGTKKISMPLDESEFDHNVNTKMLKIKLLSIRKYIEKYAPNCMLKELRISIDLIIDSIVAKGYVIIRYPRHIRKIMIEKGILSGWRWTAWLDTLSNGAKVLVYRYVTCIRAGVENSDILDPVLDFTSQGDDLRSHTYSWYAAELFTGLYSESGFSVNPSKFFISQRTDEFLRKVAIDGKILTGYPCRGLATLLFRNPKTIETAKGEDRIRELLSNWLQMQRRMQIPWKIVEPLALRDVSQANGLTNSQVYDILHAPANYGGMGLRPNVEKEIIIHKAKITFDSDIPESPLIKYVPVKLQEIAQKQWLAGVAHNKHVHKRVEPFRLEIVDRKIHNFDVHITSIPTTQPMECRMNDDLAPSTAFAARKAMIGAKRQEMYNLAMEFLDPQCMPLFIKLFTYSSLKVTKMWLDNDLLGSPPNDNKQGPIILAPLYEAFATSELIPILSTGRISYNQIKHAQLSAERKTLNVADQLAYTMCD